MVKENTTNVIKALEDIGENLIKWFSDNQMKLNTNKFYVLLNSQGPKTTKIGNLCICKKASQKINALARIAPYIGICKRRTLMNAFFKPQFNCCPLIRLCCGRSLNNKIDRLHERSLRIVYSNKISDFIELLEINGSVLLEIDGSVSIHYQNIRKLAIEMLKVSKCLYTENGFFQFRYDIPYNLRQRS